MYKLSQLKQLFVLRFLFRFVGDESEIILDGDEKERAEFSEWKWASTEEVLRQVVTTEISRGFFLASKMVYARKC